VECTEHIKDLLKTVDADGSGVINYTEFIAATLAKEQTQEEGLLWAAFKIFDQDSSGTITVEELMEVFKNRFDENELGDQHIEDVMAEVDTNGDGVIDFPEFCAMMRKADGIAEDAEVAPEPET